MFLSFHWIKKKTFVYRQSMHKKRIIKLHAKKSKMTFFFLPSFSLLLLPLFRKMKMREREKESSFHSRLKKERKEKKGYYRVTDIRLLMIIRDTASPWNLGWNLTSRLEVIADTPSDLLSGN